MDNQSGLEFSITNSGDSYIDLNNIYLHLKIKLCKADGTDLSGAEADQPRVVNNILHSLFDQCNVYFNGTQVTASEDNYHYRCYLENLLNYGKEAAETHLQCDGWALDSGNDINKQGFLFIYLFLICS